MDINSILARRGIVGVGEFDETGRLRSYKSKILSLEQADSTANLSGSLMTLLSTIAALYSRYCGVPLAPLLGVRLEGFEYSILLYCAGKTCLGVIAKNSEVELEGLSKELRRLVGG